jgi:hypothetical protein
MLNVAGPTTGGEIFTHLLRTESSARRKTLFCIAFLSVEPELLVPRNDTDDAFIWMASCENAIISIKLK